MSILSLSQHLVARRADPNDPAASRRQLEVAAEQFEALFLQQILKQMRKAGDVLAADNPLRSRELDTLRDFHDELLAETLATKKQTGIADLLVKQLSGPAANADDLAEAGERARNAELPRPSMSLVQPLREAWQRGVEELDNLWQRGSASFQNLVDSVIRQESGGRRDAVSPKGALGLMQLMPGTAREMAAELGLEFDQARLTSDADYNKRLGSAYLNKLLRRYDGEEALALAAYNAGPGRVDEWLQRHGDPRRGEIGVAEWVERIPFDETRHYTRRILHSLPTAPEPAPQVPGWDEKPWSEQLGAAGAAETGLLLGSAVGKRLRSEPEQHASSPAFKPAAETVALQSRVNPVANGDLHQSLSVAFAQPIRIERKENLS